MYYTFWPKEGSIARLVAVGPSIMLWEADNNNHIQKAN